MCFFTNAFVFVVVFNTRWDIKTDIRCCEISIPNQHGGPWTGQSDVLLNLTTDIHIFLL